LEAAAAAPLAAEAAAEAWRAADRDLPRAIDLDLERDIERRRLVLAILYIYIKQKKINAKIILFKNCLKYFIPKYYLMNATTFYRLS
jgi:hypothetical protein